MVKVDTRIRFRAPSSRKVVGLAGVILSVISAAALLAPAKAATLTVTILADGGAGSLREAFASSSSGDSIVFDPQLDGQTIELSTFSNAIGCITANATTCTPGGTLGRQFGASAFFLTTGKTLTIDATANGLTRGITISRSGTANFRLFDVDVDSALILRGLVLRNGAAVGGSSQDGGGALGAGGAIFNRGDLEIDRCTFVGNRAQGGSTGAPGVGPWGGAGAGAIYPGSCPYCGVFGGRPNGGKVGNNGSLNPPYGAYPAQDGGLGGGGGLGGESAQNTSIGYLGAGGRGGNGGFGGGGGGGGGGNPHGLGGTGGFGGGGGRTFSNPLFTAQGGFGGGSAGTFEGGPGAGFGGAIFNDAGNVVLNQSTLTANIAQGGSGRSSTTQKGWGLGGAIFNYNGILSLTFVTLAGNSVAAGPIGTGGVADGGAIYSLGDSNAACSAGGNTCTSSGATLDMRHSIASGSSMVGAGYANDVVNTALNGGGDDFANLGNWIEKWNGSAVLRSDPMLGALAANNGFGLTMLPQVGSPVVDQVVSDCVAGAAAIDQRGIARPQGAACDLGAVEVRQVALDVIVTGDGNVSADSFPAPLMGSIANCGASGASCGASYYAESGSPVVLLIADAPATSTFAGWSGDCSNAGNPATVTLDRDYVCEASFTSNFAVSASVTGGNGSMAPAMQRIPLGTSAVIEVVPDSSFHVASITGTCGGQLTGNIYTTLPVAQDCTVEARFAIAPFVDLVIGACRLIGTDCVNGNDYVQYGSMLTYAITAENRGNTTASDTVVSAASPDLDEGATTWICMGGPGTACQASGSGALADGELILPPGSHIAWIVNAPVRLDAPNPRMDYVASLSRSSDPTVHSAIVSSTLVLFRGGFEEFVPMQAAEEKHVSE